VVVEAHPTCQNLLGRIEHQAQMGALFTNFMMVKAGALHRANGGFLVLEALEVLKQYFAWDPLKRSLKNKQIKIEEPGEQFRMISTVTLEPEPIPLDVRVARRWPAIRSHVRTIASSRRRRSRAMDCSRRIASGRDCTSRFRAWRSTRSCCS